MRIQDLIETGTSFSVTVSKQDLTSFADYLIAKTKKELQDEIAAGSVDGLLTIDQVSEKLGINRSTLWRWQKKGILQPIKIGGQIRYKSSDVIKFVHRKEVKQ